MCFILKFVRRFDCVGNGWKSVSLMHIYLVLGISVRVTCASLSMLIMVFEQIERYDTSGFAFQDRYSQTHRHTHTTYNSHNIHTFVK